MARRRRSLLDKGPKPDASATDAEQVDASAGSAAGDEAVASDSDDAGSAPPAAESAPEAGEQPAPATAEERAAESDGPGADLDLEADAAGIPHSGDPDSFAEAETVMDEYGFPDPTAEEGSMLGGLDEAATVDDPGPGADYGAPVEGLLDDDLELYDGFDGLENPPTEEVQIYQDVLQPHSAPMNVPEPPPIPGIEDRFTPPPVERTELGSRHAEQRPTYRATPTPAPRGREQAPAKEEGARSVATGERPADGSAPAAEPEVVDELGKLTYYAGGFAMLLVAGACMAWGAGMIMAGGSSEPERPETHQGVPLKKGVEKNSPEMVVDLDGIDDPRPAPEPGSDEGTEAAPEGEPEGEPEPEPEPEPVEAAAPAPAPVAAPPPRPKKRAEAAPLKLQIRANRRVLVYVDGKAVGYTPIDYDVTAGTHEVMAMIAGQPASRQTKSASVGGNVELAAVDFSF